MKKQKYVIEQLPDFKTVKDIVLYGAKKGKEKTQYVFRDRNGAERIKTFNDVYYDYMGLGQYLYKNTVVNKKVAILGDTSYNWIVCYFALITGRNITVPLDAKLSDGDLAEILAMSDCEALFYAKDFGTSVEEFKKAEDVAVETYLCMEDLESFIAEGQASLKSGERSYTEEEVLPEDLACIVFTSGTTGKSKGVMLTHKNLSSNLLASNSVLTGGHAIGFLPLNHTYTWVGALFSGCLISQWGYICRNIAEVPKALMEYKPQNFSAVPLAVEMIYKKIWQAAAKEGKEDILKKGLKISRFLMKLGIDVRRKIFKEIINNLGGNLEMIVCGGAFLDPVIERGMYDFGIQIINGYGITECSPAITCNRLESFKFGSVGLPVPCNEIKIYEPDEKGVGEIFVRGSNVMLGYYNDPKATAEVFDGDWFKTGDYGRTDEDGFLYYVGRKKNIIVLSNGKNVSPEEIEDKLSCIPYVKEVLVYAQDGVITAEFFLDTDGFPDAGEKLRADVNEINRGLPVYKQVIKIKIRDTEFEKTTSLKIKRKYKD